MKLNKLTQASLFALSGLILSLSIATIPVTSAANSFSDWGITQFNSDIKIGSDSKIEVTETITADFTNSWSKHGLIRYIPVSYQDRNYQRMDIRFKLISVTDEKGTSYEVEKSREGDNQNLKIGSADILVNGQVKTYVIKYQLERGLNEFPDHDELFWNSTGNGWDIPILHSTTTVSIPGNSNTAALKAICYTGYGYSAEQDCESQIIDGHTFRFTTKSQLAAHEGISIAVSFPKGLVTFPNQFTYLLWFLQDNWGYSIPFFILLICYWYWNKHGRDPKATHSTIMPQYEAPDNLSPAEIGTLIDDRVDTQDITSSIIDLATRGYLKIIERKEKKLFGENIKYTLEKTSPPKTAKLKPFEEKIYLALFGSSNESVELDDLKYKFYKSIPGIKKSIYQTLIAEKYLASNPETTRASYLGVATAFLSITIFLGSIFLYEWGISVFIGLIISTIIIGIFGYYMPRKTQKGADTYIHILGLEEFIKTAEKDRLKFYEKENIFEKILPYAIALGIADKWAKACEGIFTENPSWYSSSDPHLPTNFSTFYFLNSLNSFNNNLSSNLTATPRSSAAGGSSGFGSGGFSGGGFGGGGGGSW